MPRASRTSSRWRVTSIIEPDTVLGLGGRYVFVSPDAEDLDELRGLVDAGKLRVDLAATFPLDRIADAHRLSEEGHTRGKIAVRI